MTLPLKRTLLGNQITPFYNGAKYVPFRPQSSNPDGSYVNYNSLHYPGIYFSPSQIVLGIFDSATTLNTISFFEAKTYNTTPTQGQLVEGYASCETPTEIRFFWYHDAPPTLSEIQSVTDIGFHKFSHFTVLYTKTFQSFIKIPIFDRVKGFGFLTNGSNTCGFSSVLCEEYNVQLNGYEYFPYIFNYNTFSTRNIYGSLPFILRVQNENAVVKANATSDVLMHSLVNPMRVSLDYGDNLIIKKSLLIADNDASGYTDILITDQCQFISFESNSETTLLSNITTHSLSELGYSDDIVTTATSEKLSLVDKLFPVSQFGILPNENTDQSYAIQELLLQVPDESTIVFSKGTYKMMNSIRLDDKSVHIKGAESGTVFDHSGRQEDASYLNISNNIRYIDWNKVPYGFIFQSNPIASSTMIQDQYSDRIFIAKADGLQEALESGNQIIIKSTEPLASNGIEIENGRKADHTYVESILQSPTIQNDVLYDRSYIESTYPILSMQGREINDKFFGIHFQFYYISRVSNQQNPVEEFTVQIPYGLKNRAQFLAAINSTSNQFRRKISGFSSQDEGTTQNVYKSVPNGLKPTEVYTQLTQPYFYFYPVYSQNNPEPTSIKVNVNYQNFAVEDQFPDSWSLSIKYPFLMQLDQLSNDSVAYLFERTYVDHILKMLCFDESSLSWSSPFMPALYRPYSWSGGSGTQGDKIQNYRHRLSQFTIYNSSDDPLWPETSITAEIGRFSHVHRSANGYGVYEELWFHNVSITHFDYEAELHYYNFNGPRNQNLALVRPIQRFPAPTEDHFEQFHVKLTDCLYHTYNGSPYASNGKVHNVYIHNPYKVSIENVDILFYPQKRSIGIHLSNLSEPIIKNCNIFYPEIDGIAVNNCIGTDISKCFVSYATSPSLSQIPVNYTSGYGVVVSGASVSTNVKDCEFYYCRHGFAGGGTYTPRIVNVENTLFRDCGLGTGAVDCHEECISFKFNNITVIGGSGSWSDTKGRGGAVLRGTNTTLTNSYFENCLFPVEIRGYVSRNSYADTFRQQNFIPPDEIGNIIISNNRFVRCAPIDIEGMVFTTGVGASKMLINGISITGNSFENMRDYAIYGDGGIRDIIISNNTFKGLLNRSKSANASFIYLYGYLSPYGHGDPSYPKDINGLSQAGAGLPDQGVKYWRRPFGIYNCSIHSNTFSEPDGTHMILRGINHFMISNNIFRNAVFRGIGMTLCEYGIMQGNIMEEMTATEGLSVWGSSYISFMQNIVKGNASRQNDNLGGYDTTTKYPTYSDILKNTTTSATGIYFRTTNYSRDTDVSQTAYCQLNQMIGNTITDWRTSGVRWQTSPAATTTSWQYANNILHANARGSATNINQFEEAGLPSLFTGPSISPLVEIWSVDGSGNYTTKDTSRALRLVSGTESTARQVYSAVRTNAYNRIPLANQHLTNSNVFDGNW